MKLLIVSATSKEIEPVFFQIPACWKTGQKNELDVLITGVGMVATTYYLTKKLSSKKFDLALNLGIAGSFDKKIRLGKIVNITEDIFSEPGAEDNQKFIPLDELNIQKGIPVPFETKVINKTTAFNEYFDSIKKVKGITVNKVLGNTKSIELVKQFFNPQTESMEGAAFLYTCLKENTPCYQIRSISNYVEQRNKALWKMEEAIKNLCNFVIDLIQKTAHEK